MRSLDIYLFDIYTCAWHILPVIGQVDSLKAKLLQKLEQSLGDLQLKTDELENVTVESTDPSKQGKVSDSIRSTPHEVSEHEP